jgi:hypothetical protein
MNQKGIVPFDQGELFANVQCYTLHCLIITERYTSVLDLTKSMNLGPHSMTMRVPNSN